MTIGLIGHGRFGTLAARFIARHANVVVYDHRKTRMHFPSGRIKQRPLAEVAAQHVVVLAVPISSLRDTLASMTSFLQPNALVIDVCSVKLKPLLWMKRILPRHTSILGAHPLFGPDSVGGSLKGRTVVLCPARVSKPRLHGIVTLLEKQKLDVRLMSPDAHDRMMAETLLLTHYVGRLAGMTGLKRWRGSTANYQTLMSLVNVAEKDSLELFRDMWHFNPYAPRLSRALMRSRSRLQNILE